MIAVFKGNPKTYVLSCYSPNNSRPEEEILDFYDKLDLITQTIPQHCMLLILGDFNKRLEGRFSYHDEFNRNGKFLRDYALQNNLIVGNVNFQKPRNKLWTWRSPRGDLAQIDYCLYRKTGVTAFMTAKHTHHQTLLAVITVLSLQQSN